MSRIVYVDSVDREELESFLKVPGAGVTHVPSETGRRKDIDLCCDDSGGLDPDDE